MIYKFKLSFWGFLISLLGTLPLGTLNMTALQISIRDGVAAGFLFATGVFIVEMLYVRVSLVGMDWINRNQRLLSWLQRITVLMILALAFGSFWSALHPAKGNSNVIIPESVNHLALGFMMSAINPVQIPFWLGWSTVLAEKGILQKSTVNYNVYILGIGIGTFLGLSVFVWGGNLAANKISGNMQYVNGIIGMVFLITGLIMIVRLARKNRFNV